MKKIGIIGYGTVAPYHANALMQTKNAQLYGVCDINPQKIFLCQQQYAVKSYPNINDMLNDSEIDGVHICTPHYLHFEMIQAALLSQKSVVVEKPITINRAQFQSLLQTRGIENVCLVFQNRLNPCVQKIKSLMQEQTLGKLLCVKGILTWNRSREYYLQDSWRGKLSTEGGGVLINQAIHTLDLICYLAGEVQSVKAAAANFSLTDTIEVEDTVSSYFKFKNGATGVFFATNAYQYSPSPELEFTFEKGILRYNDGTLFLDNKIICRDVLATGEKSYYGLGHIELIKNFYDHGQFFSIYDAQNTMSTLFAIYESAQNNSREVFTTVS